MVPSGRSQCSRHLGPTEGGMAEALLRPPPSGFATIVSMGLYDRDYMKRDPEDRPGRSNRRSSSSSRSISDRLEGLLQGIIGRKNRILLIISIIIGTLIIVGLIIGIAQ